MSPPPLGLNNFRQTSYPISSANDKLKHRIVGGVSPLLSLRSSLQYTTFQLGAIAMSAEAARRAFSMTLRELVDRYCALAPEFGLSVPLASFQLAAEETERLFSGFDEDYHISRFFHFTESEGQRYSINGIPVTHVALDSEIQTIL
jgi:hypothetical protein